MIYTRSDLIEQRCTHRQYYGQFVTKGVRWIVAQWIGEQKILQAKHSSFSDISLTEWDATLIPCPAGIATKMREYGDYAIDSFRR